MPNGTASGLVSIIIPTYNRAQLVDRAIRSALAQTYRPVEIIVVDDGSTDDTARVLRAFGNKIQVIRQPNQGRSIARNHGLETATGDYVAFLDSDDVWAADAMAAEVEVLNANPQAGICYSWWQVVAQDNRLLRVNQSRAEGDVFETIYWRNFVSTCNILIRRACFLEPDGQRLNFDGRMCSFEDWALWLRLAARHRFCCAPKVLASITSHEGNTFSSEQLDRLAADLCQFRDSLMGDPACAARIRSMGARARAVWSNRIAYLYLKRGRHRAALAGYWEAFKICPYYLPIYTGLGQLIVGRALVERWLRFWTEIKKGRKKEMVS